MASKYLSFADRTSEIAFAVMMVIIINGYVALSDLNSGFAYIVIVNLGACALWGIIDGLIYAVSSSIERNSNRNKLLAIKTAAKDESILSGVKKSLDETFLKGLDDEAKENISKEIIKHAPHTDWVKSKVITKDEAMGWLSIIGIYMFVGFLLALPFLVLHDKILAWFISNVFGVSWLFWYGAQLGKISGKNRWVFGVLMAAISIAFLALSYFVWAK